VGVVGKVPPTMYLSGILRIFELLLKVRKDVDDVWC
jgi:hypothetical protein